MQVSLSHSTFRYTSVSEDKIFQVDSTVFCSNFVYQFSKYRCTVDV